ncbi:hypothetical protein H312_03239 [Anncaliia algerae PRA339]|uniref:Ribosomal protein L23/L25 N-terminal domain-containing protein n=1 Tax=Anncaliia algerae PRA339 TaxID=1288291 RepID=A0A059EWS7_9MICR|nr:hypothetical protein H312_03239 [Anncaliia algerae PRA339]
MRIERKSKKTTNKLINAKLPTDSASLIKYGINNERTARMMEKDNTLVFACVIEATKPQIKAAVEKLYSCKVKKVRTCITFKGYKKAFVVMQEEGEAIRVANAANII